MSKAPGWKSADGRVGEGAGPVVVAGRVGHVEHGRAGDEVGHHGASGVPGGAAGRGHGDGDHRGAERDGHGGRERAVGVGADRDHAWWRPRCRWRWRRRPPSPPGVGGARDVDRRGRHRGAVGRCRDRRPARRPAARLVPLAHDRRLLHRPDRAEAPGQPHLLGLRPGQRRGRARRAAVDEADRRGLGSGAERRGRQVRVLPGLLGHQPDPGGEPLHPEQQPAAAPASPVCSSCSARSPFSTGHTCPEPLLPVGHGLPVGRALGGVRLVAVAVAVLGAAGRVGRCRSGRSRARSRCRAGSTRPRPAASRVRRGRRPAGSRAGSARGSRRRSRRAGRRPGRRCRGRR